MTVNYGIAGSGPAGGANNRRIQIVFFGYLFNLKKYFILNS